MTKMTKAEMAAQMGITPEQLVAKEAENRARLASINTTQVKPDQAPIRATTEEPTGMNRLKGSLEAAFRLAADITTAVAEAVVDLGSARNRTNTPESVPNRQLLKREREAGLEP